MACTALGDHEEASALPTPWYSLPTIAVAGGQKLKCLHSGDDILWRKAIASGMGFTPHIISIAVGEGQDFYSLVVNLIRMADLISWSKSFLYDSIPGLQCQLVELNAHSLFSKWFSESGKLEGSGLLFNSVLILASYDASCQPFLASYDASCQPTDFFYEYLHKVWLPGNRTDEVKHYRLFKHQYESHIMTDEQTPSPKTNQNPAPVLPPSFSHDPAQSASPYYIGSNDGTGAMLVTHILDGNNYYSWARSMRRALRIKNKLGFIDGTLSAPTHPNDPLMEHWLRCNDIVITWIQNTMAVDIKCSTVYAETAHQLWLELEQRFAQHNAPRIYEIKQGHSLEQCFKANPKPIYSHCQIPRHIVEKCYKLHGYPSATNLMGKPKHLYLLQIKFQNPTYDQDQVRDKAPASLTQEQYSHRTSQDI
ncbi:hypothetical protein FNV43_RR24491 [Rhamnella rubrinervis]|uniref:Retrotransposon Copia-like N-terminal domain-containing protein n=1 Tax=Rhamnella rubrinervis TaxID=2594499 RepID=A0A8K0GP57_9ROSA|nr:hypothetical protein FNV43_RR24491 [Rhamnella rubrinervis]